jgi:hypothetical protein
MNTYDASYGLGQVLVISNEKRYMVAANKGGTGRQAHVSRPNLATIKLNEEYIQECLIDPKKSRPLPIKYESWGAPSGQLIRLDVA